MNLVVKPPSGPVVSLRTRLAFSVSTRTVSVTRSRALKAAPRRVSGSVLVMRSVDAACPDVAGAAADDPIVRSAARAMSVAIRAHASSMP